MSYHHKQPDKPAEKETKMLRTIIECKDESGIWQTFFPLWFGEPSDPWFYFDTESALSKALLDLGATQVTIGFPDYIEDFNMDCQADWFHADLNLLESEAIKRQFSILWEMVRIVKAVATHEGRTVENTRIAFYKPLLIDVR